MSFPWGQSTISPVNIKCRHCGQPLEQRGSTIVECTCTEAEEERAREREQQRQWRESRKPTFDEARRRNKRPLRGS